jgi:hypothetical protein
MDLQKTELISCVCMACGHRNDHTDPNALCQNGGHDNWLEYRDVISKNEWFELMLELTGLSDTEFTALFMDNSYRFFKIIK